MSPRRRILALLPFAPRFDAAHGGGRLLAEQLEALATHHDLTVLCLRATADPPTDDRLRRRCAHVEDVVRSTSLPSTARRLARLARLAHASASRTPLWVADWWEPTYAARVTAVARESRPEIAQIEFHVMGQYLSALATAPCPTLLVEHEPGHAAACDRLRTAPAALRPLRARDTFAWERYERDVLVHVDATVVFTARDARTLGALAPAASITVIRPGTRVPGTPLDPLGTEPPTLLFVGSFVHPPNRAAALRLATTIFPRLRARFPALRLEIVGEAPPRALRRLAGTHVRVTGRVPDVTPFLARAAVVVVPLDAGGGIRVKVLEALAAGKAVVASTLALEGLAVTPGEQCLRADTDEEIVAAVALLIVDPDRRSRLAEAAHAFAHAHLGWSTTVAAYDALYDRLLGTQAAAPSGTHLDPGGCAVGR